MYWYKYVMYQCNTIKTHIDEWSFRAVLVIVSTLLILPLKLSPHDFTDNDTLEREREDRLKFVISLKPTLSLVYFPKPSGFQIEGVWRRFWPGTTVHGYSWTGALAVWRRGSPGHTPSRMRRSLDPIQPAPSRQDRPAGRQHTHTFPHLSRAAHEYAQAGVTLMATSHLRSAKCTRMQLSAILSWDLSFTR